MGDGGVVGTTDRDARGAARMKLGFLTACLPKRSLAAICDWAASHDFEALEIAAWPNLGDRPFTATHLDVEGFGEREADATRTLLLEHNLVCSSIAYYDNNLHPDAATRAAVHEHVHRCIDAAALIGCPTVGTFVGRDPYRSVSENLAEAAAVFAPLVDHAGDVGVKIIIENCVMEGWHPDGYPGNLAYSPELWEWMFSLGLYLNYDPSHLLWMGIDPVEAVKPYIDRIPHAQAKDIELDPGARTRYGWPGRAVDRPDPWDVGWWRYRVPGRGQVEWGRLLDVLYEGGFDGVLSVEHEDPMWGGTEDKIEVGLKIAHRTLRPLIVA
jgi:sugar phosphate isomerase/epimerase